MGEVQHKDFSGGLMVRTKLKIKCRISIWGGYFNSKSKCNNLLQIL